VTAQKREENLQKVPISITVLGTQQLEQQNVNSFEDAVRLLPSVAFSTFGPGFGQVYMRGVANGGDGNHSTSLPSVGVYLDEQPITTIQGPLDIHMYDIARVEALAGPQGTLYGASSEAGTLRIITNKPDPSGFAAGYGIEVNSVSHGGIGHVPRGLHQRAAVADARPARGGLAEARRRLHRQQVRQPAPTRPGTTPPAAMARRQLRLRQGQLQRRRLVGGRVALRFDLGRQLDDHPGGDGPGHRRQRHLPGGSGGRGDLALTHFRPGGLHDRWTQAR
jgi:outer membrane receptor protein involved in Fe transport